jgi:ribosomal-protein-alanine N-acetyltransferase
MPEIVIEAMRRGHIPAVLEIEKDEFSAPWTEEMFRQEIEDNELSRAFVALVDGRIVGYMASWFVRDQVHLLNIAVASPFKRRGIASRMLRFLIDLSVREKKELITLEVRASNEDAITFYKVFGFQRFGVSKGYYPENDEDALLMILYIDPQSQKE